MKPIMSGHCITNIELCSIYKALELFTPKQQAKFIDAYNTEYKRIRDEVYAEDAKRLDQIYGKH